MALQLAIIIFSFTTETVYLYCQNLLDPFHKGEIQVLIFIYYFDSGANHEYNLSFQRLSFITQVNTEMHLHLAGKFRFSYNAIYNIKTQKLSNGTFLTNKNFLYMYVRMCTCSAQTSGCGFYKLPFETKSNIYVKKVKCMLSLTQNVICNSHLPSKNYHSLIY